jgi:DNA-directed RNA polymerase specialized sigma24 family protein
LRFYEDLPDAEIAALLGCAEATVRSQISRALAAIRAAGVLDDATNGGDLP